ncbi:MAG: prepilin-type N-terminal cleavage/methylation domain-containing protein [Deltaproteobacteria bacterium]|nr:prepilin-type N-terminal cleavage/methylation domain-containing protein [Deltaproteobacteria bacterium]
MSLRHRLSTLLAQKSRSTRLGRRAQRGMTLLEIMIVLAILALIMGLVVGPRVMKMFGESKGETTKIKVRKFAHEAYPSWAAAHQDKQCPDKLTDLNEYANDQSKEATNDAWGRPLKMTCGPTNAPGVKGLGVMSFGEDGQENTSDDIKSWE